jgi:hypothetical protein
MCPGGRHWLPNAHPWTNQEEEGHKEMRKVVQVLAALVWLASGSAFAQAGFGLRAGVTADPNQFHFGGHYVSDRLIGNLTFRPNLKIGIGSNLTAVAANLEFAYRIPAPKTRASAYIGAGPSLDTFGSSGSRDGTGHTDVDGGFNLLVGLEHKDGLFGELKVGTLDSPELKLAVGFTFR